MEFPSLYHHCSYINSVGSFCHYYTAITFFVKRIRSVRECLPDHCQFLHDLFQQLPHFLLTVFHIVDIFFVDAPGLVGPLRVLVQVVAASAHILAKQQSISPHQLFFVTQSVEGQGLLFYGDVILPFIDRFPKNLELYKIMTTKWSEKATETDRTSVTAGKAVPDKAEGRDSEDAGKPKGSKDSYGKEG